MNLSASDLYQLALNTGFPSDTAVKMVAIALKESSGNPNAHNTTPPDDSYGLFQINMYGSLRAARLVQFGISDPTQLYDPATNARAAYILWNGNDSNLNVNWAIAGADAARYQAMLPAAQAAAAAVGDLAVTGGGGTTATGTSPPDLASFFPVGLPAAPQSERPISSAASPPGGTGSTPRARFWRSLWRALFSWKS